MNKKTPGLAKNLGSVYFSNAVNGLLGIALIPILITVLGSEGYGIYSIYVIVLSYVSIADMGLFKNLQRLLAQSASEDEIVSQLRKAFGFYLTAVIVLIFILPIIWYITVYYLFPLDAYDDEHILTVVVLFAVLEFALMIPSKLQQCLVIANEKFVLHSKFRLYSGITRYLLIIVVAYLSKDVLLCVAAASISWVLNTIIAWKVMGGVPKPKESWVPDFKFRQMRGMVSHTMGLSGVQIIQLIILTIGSVLVNRFFGLEMLGKYRSIFDLVSKVWFFSNGLGLIAYPKFVKIVKGKGGGFGKQLLKFYHLSWFFYMMLAAFGTVALPFVQQMLSMEGWDAFELFYILLFFGVVMNAHSNISFEMVQAQARYPLVIIISLVTLCIYLILAYVFLDDFGIISIGLGWVGSQLINSIALDYKSIGTNLINLTIRYVAITGSFLSISLLISNESLIWVIVLLLPLGYFLQEIRRSIKVVQKNREGLL